MTKGANSWKTINGVGVIFGIRNFRIVEFTPTHFSRERGAYVGGHEPSRLKAIEDVNRFIDHNLAR